jgi:hypothetical protein
MVTSMKLLRIVAASLLVVGLSTSAFAEDFQPSIAKAVEQQRQTGQTGHPPIQKGYLWAGGLLFAGGMTTAFYGFLHNKHTGYPTFGEATATDVKLGSAGLVMASAGGLLVFIGQRQHSSSSGRAPSLTFGPGRVTLAKKLSW